MDDTESVVGIVLAAGMSTRMGDFKQLLPIDGKPAVCKVVEVLKGRLDRVIVVVGHRAEEIMAALDGSGAECVFNEYYRAGMLTSVQCAVRAVGEGSDFAFCLGDQPALNSRVLAAVLAAKRESHKGIVMPVFQGRGGHPVVVGRQYAQNILALRDGVGLNAVTRGFPEDTLELDLGLSEVVEDMDTPEDYQRELKRTRRERE